MSEFEANDGPSLDALEDMVEQIVATLPDGIVTLAREIAVQIVDVPPADLLRDMEIDDASDLTGLYDGIPLTQKSFIDQPALPDVIWLFRAPIVAEWRDRGDLSLRRLVTHVYVHELAHHFGWSDADIAQIDPWWE